MESIAIFNLKERIKFKVFLYILKYRSKQIFQFRKTLRCTPPKINICLHNILIKIPQEKSYISYVRDRRK